jgi:pantoate--beta-alanine ligase
MRLARSREDVRRWASDARDSGETVALVPTMGFLHAGHLSLVDIAASVADRVALSIFVNPLQFAPGEDLERYPRDLDRDIELARQAGVDLVFAPDTTEMYPEPPWITMVPERGADRLCGAARPGHFRGVLTVVAKLFGMFRPDVAVFGLKDYQQLTLIRRMVDEFDAGVRIEAAPIMRESDGLALSSRNVYLSADERIRALALAAALDDCRTLFAAGETVADRYREAMRARTASAVEIEYADVVHPTTLDSLDQVTAGAVAAVAARVGATRLIDNLVLGG